MRKRSYLGLTLAALALAASLALAAGQTDGRDVAVVDLGASDAQIRFGGFSGLEVSPDGRRFWALSDRGALSRGRLLRDGAGRLAGVEIEAHARLKDPDGLPLESPESDAEGLALGKDGRLTVTFENVHRIWSWPDPGGKARALPRHADFPRMQPNSAMEALALAPDGALYTLPERSGSYARPFPVYRYDGKGWQVVGAVEREGEWLPVGADFDEAGRLHLLWRHFTGYGFSSRITRHVMKGEIWPGETLYQSRPLTHGNLEGLALWRGTDGRLRAVMISDDNFRRLQRSQIVEILLPG